MVEVIITKEERQEFIDKLKQDGLYSIVDAEEKYRDGFKFFS